jgi:glycosyltransferase involved in cell wall biosynthesis
MKKILIIDHVIPTPDQDAGSLTIYFFLKILISKGLEVTFIPKNLEYVPNYTEQIRALGIECLTRPEVENVTDYIKINGTKFEAIMLYRVYDGGDFYEISREYAPRAKIIFDTVDLHFVRLIREAEMEDEEFKSAELMNTALETRQRELHIIKHADATIVLSNHEKAFLESEYSLDNIKVIPLALDIPGRVNDFDNRSGIAFIGGYQHLPNVDAVEYFVKSLWTDVKAKLPDAEFYIIGSKPPESFNNYVENYAGVNLIGFVERLEPWMEKIKMTVAPLRYGAGIKGKVGSSLSFGVPCVGTNLAFEGMGLEDGTHVLSAKDEKEFVDNIVALYQTEKTWLELSENGICFVKSNYSIDNITKLLVELFGAVGIDIE